MGNRDTQFAGFAESLFNDLDPMFSGLCIERDDCEGAIAGQTVQSIKLYLAQRAYDLACHVANWVGQENASAIDCGLSTVQDVVGEIADLTTWPEEARQ